MNKVLFLGAGSKADPPFEDVLNVEYFKDKGIKVTSPTVIESCHGCHDLMSMYSGDMQHLVGKGYRVVGVLEGGLLFGLPSIQATQTTYPIISCPLDLVSYQAFMVPSGNAVVGTVGIERKVGDKYGTTERRKALNVAENILDFDEDTVAIRGKGSRKSETKKELDKFAINTSNDSRLILNFNHRPSNVRKDEIQIWADSQENLLSGSYLENSEKTLASVSNTVQVRGKNNLVNYAAKIISLQRPDVREKIKVMGAEKRRSYEERDLFKELSD